MPADICNYSTHEKKIVDDLKWIKEDEIINLTTIAQSSPGAVAVNAAILFGYQIAGVPGSLISILGTVLPPFIILSIISFFYTAFRDNIFVAAFLKGMQAGIAAVIINVVIDLSKNVLRDKSIITLLILLGSFTAVYFFHINIIYIILICGLIGILRTAKPGSEVRW